MDAQDTASPQLEDHYLTLGTDTLYMRRFKGSPAGPVLFMLHGSIENGRIFYSKSGKGLAPWLAKRGFDVFVCDLRGKGNSTPPTRRGSPYGLMDAIKQEVPALLDYINTQRPLSPVHWVAHSWGGVMLLSLMARFSDIKPASAVFFGTKRQIKIFSWKKFFHVDILYTIGAALVKRWYGYLPARKMKFGSDNESSKLHRETRRWVQGPWVDFDDGFDYTAAIRKVSLPPIMHIAAINDEYLGHPHDVRRLVEEVGPHPHEFMLLSRDNGNRHDYDHINMLTHPDAAHDHFPEVEEWLRRHSG
ncbi:alpha/beta fold hydrolase [Roseivirga sp. BDSF3-8]|uniref:alpha/beta fold hydrolase n=1 Tax=Roseivirga sp. BDSF3-8 TaxID=3241598 RepID=UPI003531E3F1